MRGLSPRLGDIVIQAMQILQDETQIYAGQVRRSDRSVAISRLKDIAEIIDILQRSVDEVVALDKATQEGLSRRFIEKNLKSSRLHLSDLLNQQSIEDSEVLKSEITEILFQIVQMETALKIRERLSNTDEFDWQNDTTPSPDE